MSTYTYLTDAGNTLNDFILFTDYNSLLHYVIPNHYHDMNLVCISMTLGQQKIFVKGNMNKNKLYLSR